MEAVDNIWGAEGISLPRDKEILYVGISRAKSRLTVVGTHEVCRECLEWSEDAPSSQQ
jgi:ATP-dependent exoDNAse (exonuclease V) alpha subunit